MLEMIKGYFDPKYIMRKRMVSCDELPSKHEATSRMLHIAWPSITESVLISAISMMDTIMVSSIGYEAIAAVGLTTQPRFLLLALFMSLNVGITAVVSRRKGEGDMEGARRTMRQALFISAIGSIILSVIGFYFARDILLFAGAKSDTIDMAVQYFRAITTGIFFNVMALAINAAQRGCGNTKISMKTNLCANGINLIGNWLLINGHLGFPKLGVLGAGIATSFGYFVAFIIACVSVFGGEGFLRIHIKERFLPDKETMGSLLNVGASAAVEQVFMRIGFFTFAKLVAGLGTVAFSTHQICINIINIAFAFGDGLAIATSSLVGQSLGQQRRNSAVMYGLLSQRVGLVIGLSISALFLSLRSQLIMIFNSDASIVALGAQVMLIIAFMCPGQVIQVIFSNALRVAGDTKYVSVVSLVSITFVRTCASWVFCYPMGLGLIGAWLGFATDQTLRLILNGVRFYRGKWTNIKL